MFVNDANANEQGKLNRVRMEKGPEETRKYLYRLAATDKRRALALVNDDSIQFSTLYIIRPVLTRTGLVSRLNKRQILALRLVDAISRKDTAYVNELMKKYNEEVNDILRWILLSGSPEDGLDNRYDEILELSASLLIRYYKELTILPTVADMIFKRYRKGALIHNLVYAFYEARNPDSLLLLANYICSQDSRDYELATKLLGFIPHVDNNRSTNPARMHNEVCQWIQENGMFLHRTDESLHLTSTPMPYILSLDAKYLCKPVSPEDGRPFRDYTEDESGILGRFRNLDPETRLRLASFSYLLYRRSMHQWNDWIHLPLQDQLRTMKMAMGGRY